MIFYKNCLKKYLFLLLLISICTFQLHFFLDYESKRIENEFSPISDSISSSGNLFYNRLIETSFLIRTMTMDFDENIYIAGDDDNILFIAKYDISGNLLLCLNWSLGSNFYCNGIGIDSEDNIYATGRFDKKLFLVKFNQTGNYKWHETWLDTSETEAIGNSIAIDSLDNIYISGYSGNNLLLLKYNSIGNQLWNQTWGGTNFQNGIAIDVDQSDDIYVVGYTNSFGNGYFDLCLIKFDTNGNVIWDDVWGGDLHDYGNTLVIASNGDIYVGGRTYSYGEGDADVCILKYNSDGTLLTNRNWGTIGKENCADMTFDQLGNL